MNLRLNTPWKINSHGEQVHIKASSWKQQEHEQKWPNFFRTLELTKGLNKKSINAWESENKLQIDIFLTCFVPSTHQLCSGLDNHNHASVCWALEGAEWVWVLTKYLTPRNTTIFLFGSSLEDPIRKAMCIWPVWGLFNRSRKSTRNPSSQGGRDGLFDTPTVDWRDPDLSINFMGCHHSDNQVSTSQRLSWQQRFRTKWNLCKTRSLT